MLKRMLLSAALLSPLSALAQQTQQQISPEQIYRQINAALAQDNARLGMENAQLQQQNNALIAELNRLKAPKQEPAK